jgi:hypothetical protein
MEARVERDGPTQIPVRRDVRHGGGLVVAAGAAVALPLEVGAARQLADGMNDDVDCAQVVSFPARPRRRRWVLVPSRATRLRLAPGLSAKQRDP